MASKFKVIVSSRSEDMLKNHALFLARVSVPAARKMTAEYKKFIQTLSDDPHRYPFADELDAVDIPLKIYRKCLFYKRYKIVYLIENDSVFIDAVIDARQENADLF